MNFFNLTKKVQRKFASTLNILIDEEAPKSELDQKLSNLTKEQLIAFMVTKGDASKQDQSEWTRNITKDKEDAESQASNLQKRTNAKRQKINQVRKCEVIIKMQLESQRKNYELEIAGLEIAIQALKGKQGTRDD